MAEKQYNPSAGYPNLDVPSFSNSQSQINNEFFSYTNNPNQYPQAQPNYELYSPNFYPTQNSSSLLFPDGDNLLNLNWDSNPNIPADKIITELTNKEINSSPSSFCSNLDLTVSEYNCYNNQCYYGNYTNAGKNFDLPSCAQISSNNFNDFRNKSATKYCTIQKSEIAEPIIEPAKNYLTSYNNYYYGSDNNLNFEPTLDESNEGTTSDIIVEESDDDISEAESTVKLAANKCIVCNLVNTPLETQFYNITSQSPLTMSSQKPVSDKINELLDYNFSEGKQFLCSGCLGLINAIDHLQLKLSSFSKELRSKFEMTCKSNNVTFEINRHSKPKVQIKRYFINKCPKYKCKLCKKILCLKKYCSYHLKRHKFNGYLCDKCGSIFKNKLKFQTHKLKAHNKRPTSKIKIDGFECASCQKVFRTKSHLHDHENYCLSILPFKCDYAQCDKKFATSSKLKNHVKLKHEKKFVAICSICNIGFIKLSDYKTHKVSHTTDKKYECSKCNKSYKTLNNLNFHLKMHRDKLPFSCTICEKGFMRKEYLEAHLNNHNGIKNYACGVCEKKFVSQKNLDSHMKYHEGSVKKNTCNVCGKTMTTGFEEHLRIHANLKEFECDLCELKFNTKGTLSKHKKNKHS